jgi:hypothetical protein
MPSAEEEEKEGRVSSNKENEESAKGAHKWM